MDTATTNRRLPFHQFILKVHGRCNLACDYCYVYEMADSRWRTRPAAMSREVVTATAGRIAEHVAAHALPAVEVVLHGGEPLLAGPDGIAHCVSTVRDAVRATAGDATEVRVALQTNGTLLDENFLRLLRELGVRVSVSIDGSAQAHDRHRRHRSGAGSHTEVSEALRRLARGPFRPVFAGLLCTVDIGNDPVETYESLLEFAPPVIDFLLPHGNWVVRPPRRGPDGGVTPYADWLGAVFDRWYDAPRRETGIRFFEEVINLVLGGRSRVEGIGCSPARMVVVETDGSIEQADVLASTFEGAAATGLHVVRDSFDAMSGVPVVGWQHGGHGLPTGCRGCAVRRICGGGLPAHRYRGGSDFDHPSVYCPDLYRLIAHVRDRLSRDIALLRGSV